MQLRMWKQWCPEMAYFHRQTSYLKLTNDENSCKCISCYPEFIQQMTATKPRLINFPTKVCVTLIYIHITLWHFLSDVVGYFITNLMCGNKVRYGSRWLCLFTYLLIDGKSKRRETTSKEYKSCYDYLLPQWNVSSPINTAKSYLGIMNSSVIVWETSIHLEERRKYVYEFMQSFHWYISTYNTLN